ncbi:MAG: PFL family protein [Deltaproteobacteria bacterium]|nr:PFL family protein [Deltaproteobacteria bacterium]MBW2052265.1 PFL family protein [Deltaproteobacteria bacterium]MBW2140831.1 PFL family protein [Deltaproteobacteria bacterium]
MAISVDEVFETASMILFQNLDIRTTTLGVNLKDCVDSDFPRFMDKVYQKVYVNARRLVERAGELELKYGVPIVNKRVAVTPVSLIMESHLSPEKFLGLAMSLDQAGKDAGIDFIGGFGALVQKGMTRSDVMLIEILPDVLSKTERICSFLNVGTTQAGLNLDAVNLIGKMLKETAAKSSKSLGCAKFVVFANAPEDNPFMAGAFHGVGEGDLTLNIGISGPGVVRNVVANNKDCDLTQLSEVVKRTVFKITRAGELIGRELARSMEIPFGIVDISLASTVAAGDSVANVIEAFGIERIGAHGSTLAIALLMDAVKKGGAMASGNVGGLSGTFLPVSEDAGMIEAVKKGALSLDKLEAFTSVCSVGLDMFAIPGDTPQETINAIIADELAIGVMNNKTTAVRVIPVFNKKAGDLVEFGGLLGSAPVMEVNRFSAREFMSRGGRLPAPLTSLRN